jgi:integrase
VAGELLLLSLRISDSLAAADGRIRENSAQFPRQPVRFFPQLQKAIAYQYNVRIGFFERDQFEAVLRHLRAPLRPLMTFFYITGCRKSEGLTLKWRQIDFRNGTVLLDPGTTKNDEGRVFPFTQELRELLEAQRAATDLLQREKGIVCPWVFHRKGQPIKSYDGAWRSACKKAGFPGRHVHDFRRTTVRRLEQAGVSRSVGMKLTGHKTESVYRRYAIVSKSDLEDAARRLDSLPVSHGSVG